MVRCLLSMRYVFSNIFFNDIDHCIFTFFFILFIEEEMVAHALLVVCLNIG